MHLYDKKYALQKTSYDRPHMARLWPAYLIRPGPFLAHLVFANEKVCLQSSCAIFILLAEYLNGYQVCWIVIRPVGRIDPLHWFTNWMIKWSETFLEAANNLWNHRTLQSINRSTCLGHIYRMIELGNCCLCVVNLSLLITTWKDKRAS